ncbi:uncharacterized protein E6C27_scaffold908G001380 [Cucumis melo var. makuwa]|uniref:Uncharacterized protein n=1 Tax=Cucumis melo var. makuwa TaxID=1194695 RepID=A0A5A7TVY8_CUCMM|nr:uncharacterized protein E6C27_scaffold908G001380 [Cucumis melo var. makuwa]
MSNLGLLRKALGSNFISRPATSNHELPLFFRQSPRFFSTEREQPPPESSPNRFSDKSNTDGMNLAPTSSQHLDDVLFSCVISWERFRVYRWWRGFMYGKLFGFSRSTLKTDVLILLEGCNLSLDDIKFEYSRNFFPVSMMIQFPSQQAYQHAFQAIARKGFLHRLERADRSQWELLSPYNGKTVFLQGIPRNALVEDVERFLSGCDYDASSINIYSFANLFSNWRGLLYLLVDISLLLLSFGILFRAHKNGNGAVPFTNTSNACISHKEQRLLSEQPNFYASSPITSNSYHILTFFFFFCWLSG